MLILSIRTDKPDAEIGVYDEHAQLAYQTWLAHRELSATIHKKIEELLASQGKTIYDLDGIVCFQGPGSFTGLRIGLTVGDALAYGLQKPIVATMGDNWVDLGVDRLHAGEDDRIALPHYSAPVHITQQKK
ncbi:MAG TPA: tRNA (adenosine(37)-N6)-threonylcarbamoyltransferase complex dimerization subunit type 1 TsaB [Candidatus Saccharimonadales bacterium]|nr:tRNA (adenosine(37)-N6)-threonylcarbamoyltransferase complex dimerization subunit type 1 TsaB [Candidatus Saccharimonadales bacterium]